MRKWEPKGLSRRGFTEWGGIRNDDDKVKSNEKSVRMVLMLALFLTFTFYVLGVAGYVQQMCCRLSCSLRWGRKGLVDCESMKTVISLRCE